MREKRNRKVGPSGPIAGLREEIEAARREKLSDEQIGQLLVRLREGDPNAHKLLVSGFRWVVYESIDIDRLSNPQVALGRLATMWGALDDSIRRLAGNTVDDVEKHIRDELYRSRIDHVKEESMNVQVPSSTQASRKKKELKPRSPIVHNGDIDVANEVRDDRSFDLVDLLEEYTDDGLEADVLRLLVEGFSMVKIAATVGVTKYRVEAIVAKFREIALRRGKG